MRQPHPELNVRRGRGAIRERRQAFSRDSLEHLCEWLGMKAEDKAQFLAETDKIRDGEQSGASARRPGSGSR